MGLISNGTTIFDNGAVSSSLTGGMVLVSSATASSSASIEFTLGSYNIYKFFYINVHPGTESKFQFNLSTDSGSNYNVTKTTTSWRTFFNEAGNDTGLSYADNDLSQGTGPQVLSASNSVGADNDQACCGHLTIYNAASTTFSKHFQAETQFSHLSDYAVRDFVAGYANTTSALTNIQFTFASGNIDAGKILMFGIN